MDTETGEISEIKVSAVIPCLNEEKTIAICIDKARAAFSRMQVEGEVVPEVEVALRWTLVHAALRAHGSPFPLHSEG